MKRPARVAARGFTLIELMTVVALLGIVAAMAAPGFRSLIGTINAKATAFDLINDLSYARSEAIKQNAAVTISPIGGNWSSGWQVVATGVTIRQRDALGPSIRVTGDAAPVTFRPNGRLATDTATGNQLWSVDSSVSGVTARCVVVTLTGAARAKVGGCS